MIAGRRVLNDEEQEALYNCVDAWVFKHYQGKIMDNYSGLYKAVHVLDFERGMMGTGGPPERRICTIMDKKETIREFVILAKNALGQ